MTSSSSKPVGPGEGDALARLSRRAQRDSDLLGTALGEALVVNRQAKGPATDVPGEDQLTRAAAHLATYYRVGRPHLDREAESLAPDQCLEMLLGSVDLASRRVQLTGPWWQGAGMPLIAWSEAGEPVALTPHGRQGYSYFDPASGRSGRVDAAFAAGLAETARAVHPTLLEAKLGFRDLLKVGLRGAARDILALVLFGVLGALVGLLTPSITASLINTAVPHSEQRLVLELASALVAVAIVVAIFQFLQATALLRTQTIFESQAQAALWHRLLRLPSDFFRDFNAGNLALRATGLSQIRSILSISLSTGVLGGIFSCLNFVVMIVYGGWLTLPALLLTLLTVAVGLGLNLLKLRELRQAIAVQQDMAGISAQVIAAIKKLRVAGAEDRVLADLVSQNNRQRRHHYAARSYENIIRSFNTVIPLFSTAVFFAVVEFVFEAPPATGDFVAFTVAYGSFIAGITGLINSVTLGLVATVIYERLQPILKAPPEKAPGALPPGPLSGHIEVNRASFRYREDGPAVLDRVSLTIQPGQFVAIVGPSGSGKSTLFRLLLGFERPQSGSVLYDGQDISRLDVAALRRQLGVVLQGAQVLGGSIKENIVGSRPLSLEDAWKAAEDARLDETIRAMPMQMMTPVNDGSTLSGGERQRLLLAGALAGSPSILFLDEATSALDNATQAAVTETLGGLSLTRVVIAHRLSTIKDADLIYVMKDGRIVESGDMENLMAEKGVFAGLVERQQL